MRKNGFYWVKLKGFDGWTIAVWDSVVKGQECFETKAGWYTVGFQDPLVDDQFDEIGKYLGFGPGRYYDI